MSKATTVDEYIDALQGTARTRLKELRALCQEAAPEASEAIKWGSPAYIHASGTILFVIDSFTKHASMVFTPSTKDAFAEELADFETGKGSVKLPYAKPVPQKLLKRMIEYRIREHVENGVKWM